MNKCIDCQADIKRISKRCRECANAKNLEDRIKYREKIKLGQPDSVCRYCEKKFKKAAGKQRFCGNMCRELNTIKNKMEKWLKE
jgi:predicted amidophosphoribosyltransferase